MDEIQIVTPQLLVEFFRGGEQNLTGHKEEINALNVYPVPDGDTGTNMGLTIKSSVKSIDESMPVSKICASVSKGALMGARGNSGVILSQILRGFTGGLQECDTIDALGFANALNKGVQIAYKSVLKPVEGTILTVSRKASEAALCEAEKGSSLAAVLEAAVNAGAVALEHTPEQLPVLKEAGVVDAGGKGFLCFLEGGYFALTGKDVQLPQGDDTLVVKDKIIAFSEEIQDADIKFHYCTELMIYHATESYEYVRENIVKAVEGDSLVCVGDEGIIKVHYHSNDPGKIISFALTIGELFDIKVENMKEQMAREAKEKRMAKGIEEPGAAQVSPQKNESVKKEKCAVVTVSSGDGIGTIFRSLGALGVISGGQTMNPSAEDLLNCMEGIAAEEFIILPNNGNVILAANQAAELSDVPVSVVPTKFMTQGFAAMMQFDPQCSAAENADAMTDALGDIQSGEITYAIRNTVTDGIAIEEGDILSLVNGKIVASTKDIFEALILCIDSMDDEDASLLTLYYGKDIEKDDAQDVVAELEQRYPDWDIEVHRGGQSLYYYLISLE